MQRFIHRPISAKLPRLTTVRAAEQCDAFNAQLPKIVAKWPLNLLRTATDKCKKVRRQDRGYAIPDGYPPYLPAATKRSSEARPLQSLAVCRYVGSVKENYK